MQVTGVATLIEELERVGELNSDNFRIVIEPTLAPQAPCRVRYYLRVEETEERHVLIAGSDVSPDNAAMRAAEDLPGALKMWGYES